MFWVKSAKNHIYVMKWKNFRFSLMKGNKRYLLFNGHRRAGREQRGCWTPAGKGWCKKLFQNQIGVNSIKYFIKLSLGLLNITSCRRSLMSLSAQTIPWFYEEQFSWTPISTMWFCNDFLIFEFIFCQTSPWPLWGIRESEKGLAWQGPWGGTQVLEHPLWIPIPPWITNRV